MDLFVSRGGTPLYTLEEAAAILQISLGKLHSLQRKGLLPTVKFGSRSVRVTQQSLQRCIDHFAPASDKPPRKRKRRRVRKKLVHVDLPSGRPPSVVPIEAYKTGH